MKPKFAVAVWGTNLDTIKKMCLECEGLGYDAFFYGEGQGPECYSTLSYLSEVTNRIRLGPGISFLSYRHPVMLAKVVATLDVLSDGRFELRLGAGAVPGYGIERPSAAMRVGMLDEGLQAMKLLWKEGKATFTGRFYQIHDATCDPLPAQKPHPPITIAAKGIKLLKVTASHANVWEGYFPPSEYMSRSKMIDNECCFIQRNSSDLERSLMLRVFIGKDEEEARERMERYIAERGISRERIERSKERDAVGDAEKCKQKIREYIQLGVTRFTLLVGDAGKLDPLKLLYEKVISKL